MLPRKISQGIGALAFLSYSVHAVEPVGALMYSNMHTVEIEKPVELYTLFETTELLYTTAGHQVGSQLYVYPALVTVCEVNHHYLIGYQPVALNNSEVKFSEVSSYPVFGASQLKAPCSMLNLANLTELGVNEDDARLILHKITQL